MKLCINRYSSKNDYKFSFFVLGLIFLPSIIKTNFDNNEPKNGTQNFSYKNLIAIFYAAKVSLSCDSIFLIVCKSRESNKCCISKKSSSPLNKSTSEERRSSTKSLKFSKIGSKSHH